MFITFADLAKLKGVSRSAVSQRRQSGILDVAIVKVGAREKLNKDLALELWEKNTIPSMAVFPTQSKKELKKQIDALPDDAIPDFNTSRARKEHWQASLAQLQVQQQKKDLIPVTQIKKSSFATGRAIRETLTNLADRLSHQLAGEDDATVIYKIINSEHREALENLSQ